MRLASTELRRAMFWALQVARCAGEPTVTRERILVSLLRTDSVAEAAVGAQVAPAAAILAIEDGQVLPFEECMRTILQDLSSKGQTVGSKEHLGSVDPLPFEDSVRTALETVMEQSVSSESVTSAELFQAFMRADRALAARLGWDS